MKKTLAIFIAFLLVLALACAFALAPPSSARPDPLQLKGIMVTDAAGYAAPYAAADEGDPFVENQTAYVVVSFALAGSGDDDYAAYDPAAAFQLDITSSTLDLSYAGSTGKWTSKIGGTITSASIGASAAVDKVTIKAARGDLFAQGETTNYYFYTFIAVTKPATAGEVKAIMQGQAGAFVGSPASLTIYKDGTIKYTIQKVGDSYAVYGASGTYLFTYLQDDGKFLGIGNPGLLTWTYGGKLADSATDKDYTDIVAEVNAFFGFSFAYNNAASDKDFTDKAGGSPVAVSDTYNYVMAAVELPDDNIPIAETGDFSANIAIVLAASMAMALGALIFTKRAGA